MQYKVSKVSCDRVSKLQQLMQSLTEPQQIQTVVLESTVAIAKAGAGSKNSNVRSFST